MFLRFSIEKYGVNVALKRYIIRIGRVLITWLVIYSPFIIRSTESMCKLIQLILFKTPAYLWYLTSVLFASIPFCLVKNRKALFRCAALLYVVGTLFGDTYKWLLGGVPWYESVFITTRNGLFFGLPLMCVGELTWKEKNGNILFLIVSGLTLIIEISIIGTRVSPSADRSMYFLLPLFVYYLIPFFRDWNPTIDTSYLGGISTAIYVMQFGIITLGNKLLVLVHLEYEMQWFVWILVLVVPSACYLMLRNTEFALWLF